LNHKQAFYAGRTATADWLPCLKVNCIRWHYKQCRILQFNYDAPRGFKR
jgi:hypothetical protein